MLRIVCSSVSRWEASGKKRIASIFPLKYIVCVYAEIYESGFSSCTHITCNGRDEGEAKWEDFFTFFLFASHDIELVFRMWKTAFKCIQRKSICRFTAKCKLCKL